MKLDPTIIIAMIKRKGVTIVAGMALGAVICAEYPQIYDLVKQAVAVVGSAAVVGLITSVVMSVNNEKAGVEEVQKALMTPPPVDAPR